MTLRQASVSSPLRIGILISGRGSNMQALVAACARLDYPVRIVQVICNEPTAPGIGIARAAGLTVEVIDHRSYANRRRFDDALDACLRRADVELICLAGFMRLFDDAFALEWGPRMLNIHPSLLPSFKGLDVHRRVLEAGVRIAGCTVHFVTPEMDVGPIVAQAAVPVLADDTEERLAARVLAAEHKLYPFALQLVATGDAQLADGGRVVHRKPAEGPASDRILFGPMHPDDDQWPTETIAS